MKKGQKFWPARSANTLEITPKKFPCIWDKYRRIHMGSMGGGTRGFSPYKSQSRFRLSLRKAYLFYFFLTFGKKFLFLYFFFCSVVLLNAEAVFLLNNKHHFITLHPCVLGFMIHCLVSRTL